MDKKIPKFCATCIDDEEIYECGLGDTPDDAFNEFMSNGHFQAYCESNFDAPGSDVEVYIYNCVDPKDSPWGDEADPDWDWCLDGKVETRIVKAV